MNSKAKKTIPAQDQIRYLVSDILAVQVTEITRIESGDSQVFAIKTTSGSYILRTQGVGFDYPLRTPRRKFGYDVEQKVIELARDAGVKAPIVIAASVDPSKYLFTFSLQEKIKGKHMDKLPKTKWPKILEEMGLELAKLHSIHIPKYGPIDSFLYRKSGKISGSYDSWREFLDSDLEARMKPLVKKVEEDQGNNFRNSELTPSQKEKLLTIFEHLDEIRDRFRQLAFPVVTPSLLHGDLQGHHFLVERGRLAGLIDFTPLIGDPLYDIAYFSVMPAGELYRNLLKTSDVYFDEERFRLYRLLISVGKIYTRYVQHNYLHEVPEILDYALSELKK